MNACNNGLELLYNSLKVHTYPTCHRASCGRNTIAFSKDIKTHAWWRSVSVNGSLGKLCFHLHQNALVLTLVPLMISGSTPCQMITQGLAIYIMTIKICLRKRTILYFVNPIEQNMLKYMLCSSWLLHCHRALYRYMLWCVCQTFVPKILHRNVFNLYYNCRHMSVTYTHTHTHTHTHTLYIYIYI